MKKSTLVLVALLSFGGIHAMAEDGAALYTKCSACHGTTGEKAALGKSKIIKDMSKADFSAALKGYKNGTYGGASKGLMKGQVATLSDAQMDAIAAHIAK